jgi:putative aldouronate transport system substrate-binding protein
MNHFTGLFGRANTQENKQTDNLTVVNGKITFTAIDPAYRDTAMFFNALYREKLIDPDSFSPAIDGSPAFIKKLAGDVPIIGSMPLWNPDNFITNWDIRDQYKPTPRLTGPKGKLGGVNNLYEMDQGTNCVITSVCRYPEVVAAFVDYLYDPWHSVKANWGKQFVEYPDGILRYPRYDNNGKLDMTLQLPLSVPEGFNTFNDARSNSTIGHAPLMISNDYYGKVNDYPATTWVFYNAQLFQGKEEILAEYTPVPPMLLTKDEQDVVSRIQPLLKGIVDRYTNQWILDGNAESTWQDYLTELNNSGLNQFVSTYQQVYDRFLASNK